jgi:hypothetical protein
MEHVLEISSRKFRDKQKSFLDLVDKGTRVILRRGSDKAYVIAPIDADELYFTPEMEKRIDSAIKNLKEGKGKEYTPEQINELLGL